MDFPPSEPKFESKTFTPCDANTSQTRTTKKSKNESEWKARILVLVLGFLAYCLLALILAPLFKSEFLGLDQLIWGFGFWLYASYCVAYLYMSFKYTDPGESLLNRTLKHVALAPLYATPIAIVLFLFILNLLGNC